jgi:hypothetical protein
MECSRREAIGKLVAVETQSPGKYGGTAIFLLAHRLVVHHGLSELQRRSQVLVLGEDVRTPLPPVALR